MKRPSKLRLAVLMLALAGFCLTPVAGKADYYPWGSYYWPSYTNYYAGYSPSYWDGYYSGGVYTAGHYPASWSSYYAPSCGGSCGSCGWSGCGSCSYGCGSCGLGCGSCSSGCGSCGLGCGTCSAGCSSCGVGCCGTSGCGTPGCGTGLACGSGCGSPTGSDCSGSSPSRPNPKKTPPTGDDNFQPRSSQDYDDAPPARAKRKAPADAAPGGPTGGASLEPPAISPDTSPAGKFTREKGADDIQGGAKAPAGDSYKPPVTKSPAGTAPADQPFETKKPVGPAPDSAKKKAPMPTVPGADLDAGNSGSMASGESEPDVFTSNPALALQEQPTWSYTGSVVKAQRQPAVRIALVGNPVPRRIKSPVVELPAVRVVQNVVRN
jgi:hypothetical protein